MPFPLPTWLPLAAVALHLVEEFVWPGGFADWYRAYRPARAVSVTTAFLWWINAVLVALAIAPVVLGATRQGIALWLVVASVGAANGAFHLWATLAWRRYSPGLVTGVLVYVPLALAGFWYAVTTRAVPPSALVQAIVAGPAYHVYAAWNHRRRAARHAHA